MTLYFSVRHAVLPLAIGLAFLELALVQHVGWAWTVVAGFLLFLLLATRRIDLSPDAISFVPLVPLFQAQTLAWADLGPFERSRTPAPRTGYDFVKATLVPPARFRMLWLYPTRVVTVVMAFAESPLGSALDADEFVRLTESVRRR